MSAKKTKKWIPVALLVLFSAGAVAALLLLPDSAPESHPGPKPREAAAAAVGTTAATGDAAAPRHEDTGAEADLAPAALPEDAQNADGNEELLPRLPTIDEEEHVYPTPFARPDTTDESSSDVDSSSGH